MSPPESGYELRDSTWIESSKATQPESGHITKRGPGYVTTAWISLPEYDHSDLYLSQAGGCENNEVDDGHVVDSLEIVLGQTAVLEVSYPVATNQFLLPRIKIRNSEV